MHADFDRVRALLESDAWSDVESGLQEVRDFGLDAFEGLSSYLDTRLAALAAHENWRVRRGVAGLLSDFDRPDLLASLKGDTDVRVSSIAAESSTAWEAQRKRRAATERRNSRLEQRLVNLKRRHGEDVASEVHALAMEFLAVVAERVGHDLSGSVLTLRRVDQVLRKHLDEKTVGASDWERSVGSLPRVAHFLQSFADDFREFVAPPLTSREVVAVRRLVQDGMQDADAAVSPGARPRIEEDVSPALQAFLAIGAVTRCIANLVKNAIEATPASGMIQVRAWAQGDSLLIRVSDTGCGMSEDLKARCFEPFRSTKRSSASKPSGLGLAIVQRKIEEHMGGQILLESELGKGTSFTLAIPGVIVQ